MISMKDLLLIVFGGVGARVAGRKNSFHHESRDQYIMPDGFVPWVGIAGGVHRGLWGDAMSGEV